jgi:hypothetical protein
MTCGELSEKQCLEAIRPFRDQIEFFEVRNVYPQIKALNQMVEQVQTEYFVPLDSDIILKPDAFVKIRTVLDKHRHDPNWHSILFPLWDTLTEKKILALKLLRSSIIKQYPFKETATPDVEHYKRLTEAGYTCIHDYLILNPIGDHVVKGKHFCYHRYRDIYQTYKTHGYEWDSAVFMGGNTLLEKARHHFCYFLYKWVVTDDEDYLHCIAGMMDGVTALTQNKSKSLDCKKYLSYYDAIRMFTDWYIKESPNFRSEYCIF